MIYDLHVHSTKSDGEYDRLKIIDYCVDNRFEYLSFTDHNYISNIDEYKKYIELIKNSYLKLINGIEFDANDFKNMHILGYGIKDIDLVFNELKTLEKENLKICKRLIENLRNKYSFEITEKEVLMLNKPLTKGSIRECLVKKGYCKNEIIAGNLYTGSNSYKYEETKKLNSNRIINLIKESGGISILAHPSTLKLSDEKLLKLLIDMKEEGLDGIEVLNLNKTNNSQFELYRSLATKLDLLESCGSDFHSKNCTLNFGIQNDISKKLIYKLEEE